LTPGSVTWDPAANQGTCEPTLLLTLTNGHLIVSLGGADGFLASVLPQTLDVTAAVDAEWRPSTGLVFKSGAALVVTIPVNARIGPAHIAVLDVGLGVDPSALILGLRLSGDIALGPFAVSVKDLRAAVALGFTGQPRTAPALPLPATDGAGPVCRQRADHRRRVHGLRPGHRAVRRLVAAQRRIGWRQRHGIARHPAAYRPWLRLADPAAGHIPGHRDRLRLRAHGGWRAVGPEPFRER
jgi:hypothetical protein